MTCIVGLVSEGRVLIGGDSAGVSGWDLTVRSDPKVVRNGDFLFGFTSSFRMGQVLAHKFTPPKRHPERDVYAFMVADFVDAIRDCFKAAGYAKRESDRESGGTFLVGYQGRLFSIEDDYQVGEDKIGFSACGCGAQVALGSMYATRNLQIAPLSRVQLSLEAAERFNAGVRGPFQIEVSGHEA